MASLFLSVVSMCNIEAQHIHMLQEATVPHHTAAAAVCHLFAITMTDSTEYYYEDYPDNFTGGFFPNITLFPDCPSSHTLGSHIYVPVLYYLIFFTGFLGNLFVICVVSSRGKTGGRLVDTFVMNLALADLIFVLTLPLWAISASQNNNWASGDLMCKLSSYVITVNRYSNIFFLTCMSVDRYVTVVRLMDSRYLRSSGCVYITCSVVWLSSLLLGVPSLVYRKAVEHGFDVFCVDNEDSSFFLGLSLFMTLFTFVFPVLIIVYCYGTIVAHLNKHCAAAVNPRAGARRRHSLKMVLLIIVAFVLSWLPFNIFKTIRTVRQLTNAYVGCETWQEHGLVISNCLAFFNSCINPAIYFFLDHHFRQRAHLLVESCRGKAIRLHSYNSSSFTNFATSESCGTKRENSAGAGLVSI